MLDNKQVVHFLAKLVKNEFGSPTVSSLFNIYSFSFMNECEYRIFWGFLTVGSTEY